MERPIVVIVGQDERLAGALEEVRDRGGFAVRPVGSADQFYAALEALDPGVVLLDVTTPGLGAEAALPRILAMKPGIRVIVLTGHGEESGARKAFLAGAFDYLCKPCDSAVLVARIHDALRPLPEIRERERSVVELMIPIDEYTCVQASSTVKEGIERLRVAAENFISTGLIMECGHRAILVFDGEELVGVLAMRNLIEALLPDYVALARSSGNAGARYSSLFWNGMFNVRARDLESKCVRDIMNPRPPVVDSDASLMQVADLLCQENRRRVAVRRDGRIVGVLREQELFHEISRLVLQRP